VEGWCCCVNWPSSWTHGSYRSLLEEGQHSLCVVISAEAERVSLYFQPSTNQMLQPRLVLPPQATYICMYVLYPLPRERVQLFNYLKV
jgi:hypothetical protein